MKNLSITAQPIYDALTEEGASSRNTAIRFIKFHLEARSKKKWSVTGGRGTAWGWIAIEAPPKRREDFGYTSQDDRDELALLLGLDSVHTQGISIPAGTDDRVEMCHRAKYGNNGGVIPVQYWD